jgi:hypothetical protein
LCVRFAIFPLAAREKLGKEYASVSKQRRNILQNILRQAAGEMQLRTPFHLVDLHPDVSGELCQRTCSFVANNSEC